MTKRKPARKVTTGHKISLATLSVLGAVAGWNAIGRLENSQTATPAAVIARPVPTVAAALPWPTIAPLVEIPRLDVQPLPTLIPVAGQLTQGDAPALAGGMAAAPDTLAMPSLAPLPTLAPLLTMPEYVPPPPPAPVQVAAAPPPPSNGGGNNVSSGS